MHQEKKIKKNNLLLYVSDEFVEEAGQTKFTEDNQHFNEKTNNHRCISKGKGIIL